MADHPVLPKWRHVFLTGLVLWAASVIATGATRNVIMIPTVVLLGSFLVPVTAITWFLNHYEGPELTPAMIFYAFVVGGVLGTLSASLLESWLLGDSLFIYVGVGLIEEFAKLLALILVARGLVHRSVRDGIVLGATVGFGFGALESSGYALAALFVARGHQISLSLGNLVLTELVRGVLAPVGHGLWTAILGGLLFGASRRGRFRITRGVFGGYLLVALLHTLWDSMRGIAMVLTALLTATPAQERAFARGVMLPASMKQIQTFISVEIGGLVLISIVGIVILWRLWHAAGRAGTGPSEVAVPPRYTTVYQRRRIEE
jgi:protease PrsW